MKNTTDTGYEIAKWIGGAAAGALLMYMLDPDRGGARRAQSAAAVRNAGARTSSALGNVWRGAGERIGAAGDELRDRAADMAAGARSGSALERMGHAASEALDAGLDKAKDTLARAGDAVGSGMDKARHALGSAADVGGSTVGDGMERTRELAQDMRKRMRGALQAGPGGEWTPAARNSALAGGGLLALYALSRRSPLAWMLPWRICFATSDTLCSSDGRMPRMMAGFIVSSRTSRPCVSTNGAAPRTAGLRKASCSAWRQFGMEPLASNTSMWASTDSMRSVTSFWNPFITDSTTIRAATPSAMPDTEISEMKEMKLLRLLRLPARV
ncbi:hypothetical protein GCM10025794_13740 [Massilia kyonggiensis]